VTAWFNKNGEIPGHLSDRLLSAAGLGTGSREPPPPLVVYFTTLSQ